ncbi:MAG: hypothetical protein JXB42_12825 [Deltaproteobacteria bacterium]|nr:hypothetical protein [Deltaproteobacteria bacterium]
MTTANTNISSKAMLVRLAISQWSSRKYDKKVSDKIARDYQATLDSGRYTKALLAAEAISKVSKIANEVRSYHYKNTLPWYDWGPRLLPAANYLPYTRKIQAYKTQFEAAVSDFCNNYQTYVDEARQRLNGLFNSSDYPTPSQINNYYTFSVSVDPLPDKEDFRVSLSSGEVNAIKADIEARTKEAQATAMKELWERLHNAVNNMVERLSDDKAIFRDSLIGNITELVDLLPRLNITEDVKLEAMRRQVEKRLCEYNPAELREDKGKRRKAAKAAKGILDDMAGYMGGTK